MGPNIGPVAMQRVMRAEVSLTEVKKLSEGYINDDQLAKY